MKRSLRKIIRTLSRRVAEFFGGRKEIPKEKEENQKDEFHKEEFQQIAPGIKIYKIIPEYRPPEKIIAELTRMNRNAAPRP